MVDWIRANTQGITEAARQVLYLLLGFEVLKNQRGETWTDAQTGLVLAAMSAVLSLIAAKTNVSAIRVEERKREAFDKGVTEGVKQAESGLSR